MGFLQELPLEPGRGRLTLHQDGATLTWKVSDGLWRSTPIPKTSEVRAILGRGPMRDVPITVTLGDVSVAWYEDIPAHMDPAGHEHLGATKSAEWIKGVPRRWRLRWASFLRW